MIVTTGAGGCAHILVRKGRGAAKHPTIYRTVPQTKNFPAPNMNNTEIEKLCFSTTGLMYFPSVFI